MNAIRQAMTGLGAAVLVLAMGLPSLANPAINNSGTESTLAAETAKEPVGTVREIYNDGIGKAGSGDLQGAIQAFDRAIAENPGFILAYIARGSTQLSLGNLRSAKASFDQAIRLNRNYSMAYYQRAYTRYLLKDRKGAITDLNQAIRLNRNWVSADLVEALVARGRMHIEMQNRHRGMADFNRAIRLNPRSSLAYASRGLAQLKLGSKRAALADLNRAIQLNQDWGFLDLAAAYGNRGLVRREMGDRQGAIADLRKAADLYQKQEDPAGYLELMSQIQQLEDVRPQVPVNLGCYSVLPNLRVADLVSLCTPEPTTATKP